MGVRPSAQHRGVGTALVDAMLAWARAHPRIQKVCLGVFSTNTVALALYRSLGFEEEGRGRRAFRLGPTTYVDDVEMGLFVKPL
jgi:RimJ/RimL family protein N-acetyltransferase